ncbi:MAG: DUF262 domain-containing protein [Phycisphaeraceae bacterium]|nr:DUF262 domain-containing protein [Phycisphaeraceae bacterium]
MKTWNIQRTQFKVSDFINWYKNQELELSPIFQRRPVWKPGAKSYLIDTMMRGLPIPAIILRDVPSNLTTFKSSREVVDGQQRIRTAISFVAPELLRGRIEADIFKISRSHNRELAGAIYAKLPKIHKQNILDYQFMVHIFPSDTEDREILEIFARMNATGYKLTNQELRNATFFGEFKTSAYALAAEQLPRWRQWSLFTETQIARMSEVELTSELMILIIDGISEGNKATIDGFYKRLDETYTNREEVERRFRGIMNTIEDNFDELNRAPFEKKTLFYPFFSALYACSYGLKSSLARHPPNRIKQQDIRAIAEAGNRLDKRTAKPDVLELTQRRVSQAGVRRKIAKYLVEKTSVDANEIR